MQRTTSATVTLLTAAALALTGCGGSGGAGSQPRAATVSTSPSDSVSPTPVSGAGIALTKSQIDRALLAVSDLPTGFAVDTSGDDSSAGPSGCAPLDALQADKKDTTAKGEASFSKGSFGPFVSETVATQPGVAKRNFDRFSAALDQCQTFTSTDSSGQKSTFHLAALSFPQLGDETFAVRVSSDTPVGPVVFDVVVVRLGETFVDLVNGGLGSADTSLTEQLARTAVQKVQQAAR